ncbi:glycine-rich cell wall structural protein-like [Andrographis paniculata]|uniref:glycine-rich cell wall structural protein-like n=1 Tax=Andrographis paniculata TaxID=175694 RepID=UPI0021E8086D|nr:glycine-rich cell wall structural protein-like [Andrographis paniculata]
MASKSIIFLVLFLAAFVLIVSEATARDSAETDSGKEKTDQWGGYGGRGGGGYGGYRGGYGGGYPRRGGWGGGCRYRCGYRCCSAAEKAEFDAQAKPQN